MTTAQVLADLARPDPAARPMMRWWWFGPDVERGELERELDAMAAAGIGGVEIALVYPLRPGAPDYLSPEVRGHLRFAAEAARARGLRCDVTLGSGWSYGGAHVGPEHASRRIRWERRDLGPQPLAVDLSPRWPEDELIAVNLGDGLPPSAWQRIEVPDEGPLVLPAGRGPRTVLLAWSEVTGQQVKRAAAGSEGPVVDHLSAQAVRHHLDVVGGAILEAVPAGLLGSVFSDSLEVYAAGWTAGLPAHFAERRGYDLLERLPLLHVGGEGAEQLREDYGLTLSELVAEGFVATCRDWAEEHGTRFRLQGYGEPPITLSAQRGAHLIEGEGAGWTGMTQSRWASSAAHLDGRDVVSSEVWTWVHSPSFRAAPLDLLGEAHEHLLLGINHLVGHGWPYTAPDAAGLGWTFYAAGALDDRNAWWPAMPELMAHLTRLSAVLRRGEPGADVALYLPYGDVRAARGAGHDLWRACRDHVGPAIPETIRRAGYDLDLVDDDALAGEQGSAGLDPAAYPVVVLPHVTRLPAATAAWLDRVREAGGHVIAVGGAAHPTVTSPAGAQMTTPGTAAEPSPDPAPITEDGFEAALRSMLPPPLTLTGSGGEVGVLRRRLADGDLFLLANTGPQLRTIELAVREPRAALLLVDPDTGERRALPTTGGTLELHPYQALLLLATDDPDLAVTGADATTEPVGTAKSDGAVEPAGTVLPLDGPWTLHAPGQDPRPVTLPHLVPGEDAAALPWLSYECTVTLDAEQARGPLVLDLGAGTVLPAGGAGSGYRALLAPPVREIAAVSVDGEGAGLLWRAPFRLDLTGRLREGTSTLRLEVRGTTAPAAADPVNAQAAAQEIVSAHEAYGERFQQQELPRMLDGVALGLGAVPVLRRG